MGDVVSAAPEFDHFLLTRFNTRLGERASDEWLRHRINYFERLCRHSVMNQTIKSFRWLIYFDSERDPWFQSEVDRLSAGVFEPIWVEGNLTPEVAASAVEERAHSKWVITTRVDNDDAISRDFIECVQAQFAQQDFEFINFQSGIQLSENGQVFYRSDPLSPFISLIEKYNGEQLRGVYVGRHDRINEYGPVKQVVTHPMWLQMVHGLNIGNALRGVRATPEIVDQYFDVQVRPEAITKIRLRASQVMTVGQLVVHVLRKPRRLLWVLRVALNRLRRTAP